MEILYSNSILMVPLLFWIIQSFCGIIRHNLVEVREKSYFIEILKSVGYNLCCIALSIDIGLLSQYNSELLKKIPKFWLIMTIHILALIFSFSDQISYKYFYNKIQESNNVYKKRFLNLCKFIVFCISLGLGVFCVLIIFRQFSKL